MTTPRLTNLRESAPDTLAPAVLLATGLRDGVIVIETDIGRARLQFSATGLTRVRLLDAGTPRHVPPERPTDRRIAPPDWLDHVAHRDSIDVRSLEELPVDLNSCTPFQRQVLDAVRSVPRGDVTTYMEVATRIGRPRASRAVGTAIGHNPVPLVVPCHRVLRRDGGIGGYLYGSRLKRELLRAESSLPD